MFYWWLHPPATIHQSQLGTPSLGCSQGRRDSPFTSVLGFCFVTEILINTTEARITWGFHHASHSVYHTLATRHREPASSTAPVGGCLSIRLDDWHVFRLSPRSSPKHLASCLPSQLCDGWQLSIFGSLYPPTRSPAFHKVFPPSVVWKSIREELTRLP